MGLIKKILSPVKAITGIGLVIDLFGKLIESFIPKVPGPPSGSENGQAFDSNLRNNGVQLRDVKPVGYGQYRCWFKVKNSYLAYEDSEQVIYFWGHVTKGYAQLNDLNVNTTPLANFGQQLSALLWPGVPLPTWMHPNVYTSGDVGGQELVAGAINRYETDPESVTVTTGTYPSSSRITRTDFFDGAYAGIPLTIIGSAIAGTGYTIRAVDGGDEPNWVEVTPSVANGTYTAAFQWDGYDTGSQTIVVPGNDEPAISLVFSAGPDQVSNVDGLLSKFNNGDVVRFSGTAHNDGIDYTARFTDGGYTLGLSPAPTPETISGAKVRLLRRRQVVVGAPRGERTKRAIFSIFYGQGLGFAKGDTPNDRKVSYELRYRSIDDAGNALTGWTTINFSQTDNVLRKPRRIDYVLDLPDAIRPQFSLARITSASSDTRYVDGCSWGQLRCELEARPGEDQTVDPDCTTIAIRVRVSGQLTALQQQTFNGQVLRMLPIYSSGSWSNPVVTRNPHWANAHWLVDNSEGAITLSMLNVDAGDPNSFVARAAAADSAGVHFDANIESEVQFWQMAQSIADRDQCELFLDTVTRKLSIARDEASMPIEIFGDGLDGCKLGDPKIDTPTSQTKFGVRGNFTDPTTWQQRDDGPVYGSDDDPREISIFGCTEWAPAYARAAFEYKSSRYRVIDVPMTTKRAGLRLKPRSRIWIGSKARGMGDATKIYSLDGTAMMVLPPVQWTPGAQHYVILQSADGHHSGRINVTRGATDQLMTLATAPAITLPADGSLSTCLFGWDATAEEPASGPAIAICQSATANGLRDANVDLTLDDARVYESAGDPPIDPRVTEGVAPDLAVTITSFAMVSGKPVVTLGAVTGATEYEYEYQWGGELSFQRFNFGALLTATVPAVGGGVLRVRARAYGDAAIGPYSSVVELIIGGAGALVVTLSRYDASGAKNGAVVTTGQTISPIISGGTGPYTGIWIRTPIDGLANALNTAGATKFQGNVGISGYGQDYMFYRATDSLGAVADSPPALITLESFGGSTA